MLNDIFKCHFSFIANLLSFIKNSSKLDLPLVERSMEYLIEIRTFEFKLFILKCVTHMHPSICDANEYECSVNLSHVASLFLPLLFQIQDLKMVIKLWKWMQNFFSSIRSMNLFILAALYDFKWKNSILPTHV